EIPGPEIVCPLRSNVIPSSPIIKPSVLQSKLDVNFTLCLITSPQDTLALTGAFVAVTGASLAVVVCASSAATSSSELPFWFTWKLRLLQLPVVLPPDKHSEL